jgi:dsDNA-binding SOS-regulon protein
VVRTPAPLPAAEAARTGQATAAHRDDAPAMIEIEYIVKDRNGVERLRTADKKAADAYDRVLENADRLAQLLRDDGVLPTLADGDMEELTIYLAQNAKSVERVLKGKEPQPRPATDAETNAGADADAEKVTNLKAAG